MAKKKKIIMTEAIPQTIKEAEDYIKDIGKKDREIALRAHSAQKQIDAIKEELSAKAVVLEDEIEAKTIAVHAFVAANRDTVLPKGKKSVTLETGDVGFRNDPPSLHIKKKDTEALIKRLKAMRLGRCITTTVKVDKNALMVARKKWEKKNLPIEIRQQESFFLKPSDDVSRDHSIVIKGPVK